MSLIGASDEPKGFATQGPKLGFVPSFDGIRGIGVMMVLLDHAYPVAKSMSTVVDGFFIISGFLITTLLFEEHKKTGGISLRAFYARRGIRLLPALAVTLVIGFVLVALFAPTFLRLVGLESLAAFFYVHNIFYPPVFGAIQFLGPMWTLSVEEQFYFIVSISMFLLVPRTRLKSTFAALLVFYIVVNVSRISGSMGPGQVWLQRPDACALGMMLAIVNAWIPPLGPQWNRLLKISGGIAAAILAVTLLASPDILHDNGINVGVPFMPKFDTEMGNKMQEAFNRRDDEELNRLASETIQGAVKQIPNRWYWVRWGFTVGGICWVVMIFSLVRLRELWFLSGVLALPPLRLLGRASYALYISHFQLYRLVEPMLVGGFKAQAVQKILIALVVGFALHRWVEKPGMRLKERFSFLGTPERPAVAAE